MGEHVCLEIVIKDKVVMNGIHQTLLYEQIHIYHKTIMKYFGLSAVARIQILSSNFYYYFLSHIVSTM